MLATLRGLSSLRCNVQLGVDHPNSCLTPPPPPVDTGLRRHNTMGNSASSKLISAAEDNKIKVVKKILARRQRQLDAGMKISDKKIIDINYGNKFVEGMTGLGGYKMTVSLPRSFICVCVYPVHVYN